MKSFSFLLTLILLQTGLHSASMLPDMSAGFSFEDFLKQLETQDSAKDLNQTQPQDKDLKKLEKADAQSPFLFDMPKQKSIIDETNDQSKKLEQEIINLLNQKITPLANDLSKIVYGPESKKALEEKKKQREQEEKAAARRIEQMKQKRPSGYVPSYRPSGGYSSHSSGRSGGYGSGYGSGSYGRGGYGSGGYSGYSPSSNYWNRYKGDDNSTNDQNKSITTGKTDENDKDKYHTSSGSKINKETKKVINSVNSLTKQIQALLSQELAKIDKSSTGQELANSRALIKLNDLFDQRQSELFKLEDKKANLTDLKTGDLEKEKSIWTRFAPEIVKAVTFKTETENEAQKTGRELLSSLRANGYISGSVGKIPGEKTSSNAKK